MENTPAVLSLGKLCDENGYSLRMDQWSKTTSHQKRASDTLQYGELRSYRGSRLVNRRTIFRAHTQEKLRIWVNTVFILISPKIHLENSASNLVQLPLDEWPETTSHQERQENSLRHIKSCAVRRTLFIREFLYLIKTFPTSSSKETVTDTSVPATRRSE